VELMTTMEQRAEKRTRSLRLSLNYRLLNAVCTAPFLVVKLCVIPPLQLCSASCFASGFGLFRPDAGHFLTCVNGDATAARVQGVYRRLACRPSASSTTFFCWCRCRRERE